MNQISIGKYGKSSKIPFLALAVGLFVLAAVSIAPRAQADSGCISPQFGPLKTIDTSSGKAVGTNAAWFCGTAPKNRIEMVIFKDRRFLPDQPVARSVSRYNGRGLWKKTLAGVCQGNGTYFARVQIDGHKFYGDRETEC